MNKSFWMGFGAAVVTIWALKNVPMVSTQAAPILAKAGI